MLTPSDAVHLLGEHYRLNRERPPTRGKTGAVLARGAGSSVEFLDRRPYRAGDDLKRLDWRAYGRTDTPYVQLYREEIDPHVEVLLDVSKSMSVHPEKAQLALDIAALAAICSQTDGCSVRVWTVGESPGRIPLEAMLTEGVEFSDAAPLGESLHRLRPLLRSGATRLLVSDFLSPADPSELVRGLSTPTGSLALVQVLAREDRHPPVDRALRLIDSESSEWLEIILTADLVRDYQDRLKRLQAALAEACATVGARLSDTPAEVALDQVCRDHLAPDGILALR